MVKKSYLSCPQCLHHNPINALKCSLCDWTLKSDQCDETVYQVDPGLTTAPVFEPSDIDASKDIDPDLTQAPLANNLGQSPEKNQYTTSPELSIAEKQTFHLAGDLAHFEIYEILGKGGMGAVYHAKDRTLHRDVAIKMLRPMLSNTQINTEALLDEARMASKLNHPNIVTIYDVARSKDSNYIVMEWVDGKPLDELIPNDGLVLEKALEYACQIADGLADAHQKYIIHRDIKPQNIMLSTQNNIKILDFGIAGYVNNQSDDNEDDSVSSNTSIGTPSYMSPEQAQGLNLDQRTDIFSFGIVLYQMLCGQRPFHGRTLDEVKQAICTADYIPLQQHVPDLPQNVINLVEKMLATKKDQRWQSSAQLSQVMHEIYDDLTYKKNWWQRRGWISKAAIILPFILTLGWSSKEILFPASTQQLIQRQLQEATKIAILPFDNISGDPLLKLFSDGMAVNLGSDLSAIASHQGNTWIVPSTEISRMKDQSPQKVADKYGVNLILTGSIQHMGSTRLLVLNLLNGLDGQQLKTVEVSMDADKLFQGHAEVRKQALTLLGWSIPDELKTKFKAQRPQLDGAYKEYVLGKGYLYRYDQSGNLDKALEAFKKAIETDNSYEKAYAGLNEVQLRKFIETQEILWLEKAINTISQLAKVNPNNSQINFLSAEIAMKKGEYNHAVSLYQASINQNHNHTKSKVGLAKAFMKLGNTEMAKQIYENSIQKEPNNWRVASDFGIFNFQIGDYQKALQQFRRLSIMSPNNDLGVRNMAAAYYALGEIENAIIYSRKAIKLKPSDRAYGNLGTMLFYIKKYNESIQAYKKAIELQESDYLHWGNLADAYKLTFNKQSEVCFQNAIERALSNLKINPNDTSVMADIAYYYANLKREKSALYYAKQIGKSNNGSENFIVATAYNELKNTSLAIRHLQIALNKGYPIEDIINSPLLELSKKDKQFEKLIKAK